MACWQRNWQLTQPPADARRRRVDMNAANTSAAAMAAPPVATVAATTQAAVPRKWPAGSENTSSAPISRAANQPAGRA